jgi:hypothetical protein
MNKTTFVTTMCLLSMVLLVPLTARSQGNPFESILNAIAQVQTQTASIEGPRAFYLTQTGHTGAQVLTACAAGFHMASLWEISDLSDLRYETTLGLTTADAGSGPPANELGWIRTGRVANGLTNCDAWTSSDLSDGATVVTLDASFSGTDVGPWTALVQSCNLTNHVWCLED